MLTPCGVSCTMSVRHSQLATENTMYNGRIIKASRQIIKGSRKQGGWSDEWDEAFDIEYDGELTDDVCAAIVNAFKGSKLHYARSQSSYGCLRWSLADSNIHVNTETRQLVVTRGQGLCD